MRAAAASTQALAFPPRQLAYHPCGSGCCLPTLPSLSSAPFTPAAELYACGSTLGEHWRQLQQRYGALHYRSAYFVADPPSRSAAVFQRLRAQPPRAIGGLRVLSLRDLGTGVDTAQPGGVCLPAYLPVRAVACPSPASEIHVLLPPHTDGKAVLPWLPGDLMVTYTCEGGAWVTVRASGTEPKLKASQGRLPRGPLAHALPLHWWWCSDSLITLQHGTPPLLACSTTWKRGQRRRQRRWRRRWQQSWCSPRRMA